MPIRCLPSHTALAWRVPDGKIEKIYGKVKAKGHAAEVLAAL